MGYINVKIDDELHIQFKLYSVKSKYSMNDILVRLIKKELEENNGQ